MEENYLELKLHTNKSDTSNSNLTMYSAQTYKRALFPDSMSVKECIDCFIEFLKLAKPELTDAELSIALTDAAPYAMCNGDCDCCAECTDCYKIVGEDEEPDAEQMVLEGWNDECEVCSSADKPLLSKTDIELLFKALFGDKHDN